MNSSTAAKGVTGAMPTWLRALLVGGLIYAFLVGVSALEAGVKNPDVDLACQAALYRLAPTPERLAALRSAVLGAPRQAYLVVEYLADHTDAAGKALAQEVRDARKKKKKKKR